MPLGMFNHTTSSREAVRLSRGFGLEYRERR